MLSSSRPNLLSHHSSFLVGGDSTHAWLISTLKDNHSVEAQGNPDFSDRKVETFTIDDARELKVAALMRPVADEGKIFVLQMNGITVEAQNALLKLLEEPPEYAHFFIIVPSAHLLLPTVKSRLSQISAGEDIQHKKNLIQGGDKHKGSTINSGKRKVGDVKGDDSDEGEDDIEAVAQKFLKSPLAKRMEIVKGIVDDIFDEKKTKQDAIEFLNAVESIIYKEKGVKAGREALEAIDFARKYLNDRAPSVKMLLEYIAFNV